MKFHCVIPDWPLHDKVGALTSCRTEGNSFAPFDGFNLALHVGDQYEHVVANRVLLREQLQLNQEPKWLQQTHSDTVVNASSIIPDKVSADASYTNNVGVVCAVLTADCLPIVFSDKRGTCVGIAHAGWRGLLKGIIQRTIEAMSTTAEVDYAWLGPAIGPKVFEVGEDVYEPYRQQNQALQHAFSSKGTGKWNLDIYKAAKIVLAAADISNVYGGDYCTYTDSERFYSYRRSKRTGRMATLIWIK